MKKTYTQPEVEVSVVSAQDVLNASADASLQNESFINAAELFWSKSF